MSCSASHVISASEYRRAMNGARRALRAALAPWRSTSRSSKRGRLIHTPEVPYSGSILKHGRPAHLGTLRSLELRQILRNDRLPRSSSQSRGADPERFRGTRACSSQPSKSQKHQRRRGSAPPVGAWKGNAAAQYLWRGTPLHAPDLRRKSRTVREISQCTFQG